MALFDLWLLPKWGWLIPQRSRGADTSRKPVFPQVPGWAAHPFAEALPAGLYAHAAALKHSVEPHISSLIKNVLVLPLRLALCQLCLVTLIEATAAGLFCAFAPKCALFGVSHPEPEAAE